MATETTVTETSRPDSGHNPRPVIWSGPLWDLVTSMRLEAEVLRRVGAEINADARVRDANRLATTLISAEGEVWVTTAKAETLIDAKADTIRSWARRKMVRACRRGGNWLFHRDDLLRQAGERGAS